MEIGAAYGDVSLKFVETGKGNKTKAVAVDIDPRHLEILKNHIPANFSSRITCVAGQFPEKLEFPDNYFDTILANHLFHFLEGKQIEQGIKKMHRWLKPGGKIVVVTATPFTKPFESKGFTSIFEEKKKEKKVFPGFIHNFHYYLPPESAANQPEFFHTFDKEILTELFKTHNFEIVKAEYAESLISEIRTGRKEELVGVIAQAKK